MDLKKELRRRELKQVKVAAALRIHPSQFCGICNGWLRPTPAQRARIAGFLDVEERELFPRARETGE